MHGFRFSCRALSLTTLVLAFVSFTTCAYADLPQYRANAIDYFENKLPSPVVIYVYKPDGYLVSIMDSHGHNDIDSINKVGTTILNGKFPNLEQNRKSTVEKAMKNFLLDQGYNINNVVNKKYKYTLVVTLFEIKKDDCAVYEKYYDEYNKVIINSTKIDNAKTHAYSVVTLKLESPLVHLRCKK